MSAGTMRVERGPAGDIIYLSGGVRLQRGRTVIRSTEGRYVRAEGTFYLDGNVVIVDSTTTITCDHASYEEQSDRALLLGDVRVLDRDATITGQSGVYDRKNASAVLVGAVRAADRDQRLRADSLIYLRSSQTVRARSHVVGTTTDTTLELRARSVDYDRVSHWAAATGDPVLYSRDRDGRETRLYANRLRLNNQTRVAEALDSVRMERDTLQARADKALFFDREQRGYLLGSPRAWDNETRVSGDTIEVLTEQRALRRLLVRQDAIVDYAGVKPGTVGEKSRLAGELVDVWFTGDKIDSLVATGNAHDDYQAAPQPGKTPEKNYTQGDSITVHFKDGKIARAVVQGRPKGRYQLGVAEGDTLAARQEVVDYDARRIEFRVPDSRIVLEGNAHLDYRELGLSSTRVEFDSDQETLVASGDPQLVDRGDKVTGGMMTYDLGTRTGNIYQAQTTYERGIYRGEQIHKAGENLLEVLNGSYTTCDLISPHYRFQSHWMKIYLKDKLVAKPLIFYVRNVPLLALPFYIFPIKPGRHSGFLFPQFEFGFNSRAGQFIRNAGYYWAVNDYADLTFSGDYYEAEPSWVVRSEGLYKLLYVLDGRFSGTFARSERDQLDRWDFQAAHTHTVTDRSNLTAQANFVSSRDYARDLLFGRNLEQRLNRFLVSSLAFSHRADWATFNLVADRRQDLDADEPLRQPPVAALGRLASLANLTETTPRLSVLFPTRTLGSLRMMKGTFLESPLKTLYFGMNATFESFHERRGFVSGYDYSLDTSGARIDSSAVVGQRNLVRRGAASGASLAGSNRLFGWLNLTPALNAQAVVFDHDEEGNDVVPAAVWNASLSSSATFYGTVLRKLGPLEGIRHVVFPTVNLSYSPDFSSLRLADGRSRFSGFGGINISGFRNERLNFGLDQRLQVKWRRGEEVLRLDNLLSWSVAGSYNFLYRSQGLKHPFSTLSSSVFLQPPGVLNASLLWTHDLYASRPVRNLSFDVGLNLSGRGALPSTPELPLAQSRSAVITPFELPWSLGLSYSYAGGVSADQWIASQRANGVLRINLSPSWHLDYTNSYDITERSAVSQEFTVIRDLHCWQARLSRRFTGGENEYYFRIGIKEQPEIYLERGSRGVGSIGGFY